MELTSSETFILALGALGLGIVMLIRGGNWTIDAAVYIADHFGISKLIVGFTIVAFGTSLPELIVSVNANLNGAPGIAFGNVLGSNIANILLVLGVTGFVATIVTKAKELNSDLLMMIFATALLGALMVMGEIGRLAGAVMLLILVAFTFWQYRKAHLEDVSDAEEERVFKHIGQSVMFLVAGLAFIAFGAEFLVRGAMVSATVIGVPDAVIALSVVAVGTSLPELSTCLIAAKKKQGGLILGNIIGSNVFNILMIMGVTALVKPLITAEIAPQLVNLDIWVTLGVSVLFAALLVTYKKINRAVGIAFLAAYTVYVAAMYALYMI
jgi:cation:H+ antiporter